YLRTHPLTLSRIADAESRVRQYPAIPPHSDQEFQRIRSQLLVDHYTNPEAAVRFYRSQLQRITDEDEGKIERGDLQYGLALALLHADRADEARQQLLPLLQQNPDQATLLITMAKAEAESNRLADALQRIQQARDLYPVHLGLTLFHAELLQQAQQWARAIEVLLQGGESYPTYPSLHRALSTTYNLAQHPAQSHLSLAHFHFLRGETPLAIRQLEYAEQAAQAAPNNFILFATIDERRRLYEEKEQQEESEGHLK
ncbi:MAG: tetratricopeptide repeat protein, partial [Gammaproteobacteria bacterium]|nr:tetratricopeptide repeat protein [Gammaproteobacteria bacterium]